ncbi:hypothetical protein [Halorarius halobius]|uniref:hypothetical protein n=1 Tax=Halorarius halobius TaxID=2962671 RepID=UPI0020CF3389|nr:hypothetical protein [Halorarius halobius]
MTRPTDSIDPLVPQLPTEPTPTLLADGGDATSRPGAAFDRRPDTSHAPNDRCTEEIEPLVPDMR